MFRQCDQITLYNFKKKIAMNELKAQQTVKFLSHIPQKIAGYRALH
jgi:hypothetical protein